MNSVNQRLPSGPATIPVGKGRGQEEELGDGARRRDAADAVVDRLGEPEVAVGAGGDPLGLARHALGIGYSTIVPGVPARPPVPAAPPPRPPEAVPPLPPLPAPAVPPLPPPVAAPPPPALPPPRPPLPVAEPPAPAPPPAAPPPPEAEPPRPGIDPRRRRPPRCRRRRRRCCCRRCRRRHPCPRRRLRPDPPRRRPPRLHLCLSRRRTDSRGIPAPRCRSRWRSTHSARRRWDTWAARSGCCRKRAPRRPARRAQPRESISDTTRHVTAFARHCLTTLLAKMLALVAPLGALNQCSLNDSIERIGDGAGGGDGGSLRRWVDDHAACLPGDGALRLLPERDLQRRARLPVEPLRRERSRGHDGRRGRNGNRWRDGGCRGSRNGGRDGQRWLRGRDRRHGAGRGRFDRRSDRSGRERRLDKREPDQERRLRAGQDVLGPDLPGGRPRRLGVQQRRILCNQCFDFPVSLVHPRLPSDAVGRVRRSRPARRTR